MKCEEKLSDAIIFSLPRRDGVLRLRIAALACGAVRVTRTLRQDFLPSSGITVIDRAPGQCAATEAAHHDCPGNCSQAQNSHV